MTWIKEETLFTVLNWLSPVTTGIIITIYMCEGFYISLDDPLLVFYWKVPTYWTFQSNLETLATKTYHANTSKPSSLSVCFTATAQKRQYRW